MKAVYVSPKPITKEQFHEVIYGGSVEAKCSAVIDAVHFIDDYKWMLSNLKTLLKDPNKHVRSASVIGIGHIARLNSRAQRTDLISLLRPYLNDRDIEGVVQDAIDDIEVFIASGG